MIGVSPEGPALGAEDTGTLLEADLPLGIVLPEGALVEAVEVMEPGTA